MSGRFVLLGSVIYLLFFLAMLTINPGPLIVAIPLVVYLGFALLNRPPHINVTAQRTISADYMTQNQPVKVHVEVVNNGDDLEELTIQDHLPEGIKIVTGSARTLASLLHGESLHLEYTAQAPRGSYEWKEVIVSAEDHLGILRQEEKLEIHSKITYLPDIPTLKKVAIRPSRTHGHSGPIPSRKQGAGVDFFGLREYQIGDPRRWINWKASERHDQQLFVNQFEQERIADVGIILDARQQSDVLSRDSKTGKILSLFEYSVRATGALCNAFLDDGNRVGLVVYGFGMERVFPGYGKVQKDRIRKALGAARTGHNFALESLRYLPTRFFPAGSQVVMVSPLLNADLPAFTRLRASGYEVLVITPDPVDFEARGRKLYGELPWQLAKVERALMLHKLTRMGVRVVDWDVAQPFEPLVRSALSRAPVAQHVVLV